MASPPIDPLAELDPAKHRALGSSLFNYVWTLLEKPDRTDDEDAEMVHAAHASCFHWSRAEGREPVHAARGEWQCSRVYSVLGRSEPALWHARRCLAIVEANDVGTFDLAAAYEALARASSVAGDRGATAAWKSKAAALLDAIDDAEDREIIEGDIATLP